MKIAQLNLRSLCSKFSNFADIVSIEDPDIIGVTETWLSDDNSILPSHFIQLPGYQFHRRDRLSRGGGVGT